jgi:hypothetical protein
MLSFLGNFIDSVFDAFHDWHSFLRFSLQSDIVLPMKQSTVLLSLSSNGFLHVRRGGL